MKAKEGQIIIGTDKKVYFEYYKLEKPDIQESYRGVFFVGAKEWDKAIANYEASKQLVEVSNINVISENFPNIIYIRIGEATKQLKDGESCEASIKNNKAIIIELIK